MGEYRGKDWQGSATSVRDRMDHLYNNTDMADICIQAVDEQWWWGQTVKDFTAHKLVLCAASPVFHQLFYPADGGPDIPTCLSLSQGNGSTMKMEIDGIPPIAVEALLEYCYKDRFDRSDYENGYSRNLLWRLWHASKIFKIKHLLQICTEALETTMCDETVFWDLNYSLVYQDFNTDNIRKRVRVKIEGLGNNLYNHPNLVWLDSSAIREILQTRAVGSSEPIIVLNNIIRWALYQLDRTLCEEVDGKKDADIPLKYRLRIVQQIKDGKIKDYNSENICKYLERVIDLVPWEEMSQKEFIEYVIDSSILDQERLISACKGIMTSVIQQPDRLCNSVYNIMTDPTTNLAPIAKALVENRPDKEMSPLKSRNSIKSSLEAARLRRSNQESRKSMVEPSESSQPRSGGLLLVE